MKLGGLDGYLRFVKKEDARPTSLTHDIWKWKFSTPQHQLITRAVCDFLLLDKHPVTAVEGHGLKGLIQLL